MGQMDVASAPGVISGLGTHKEPMDRDSPEAGAFTQREHRMGLVCKKTVRVKGIEPFTASRD